MNFLSLIRLAGEAATETAPTATEGNWLTSLMPLAMPILLIVLMYFLMIRPQQKKQKEEAKMRANLRVGDELTTIGGICGRVVNIKDDTVTIESSVDRSKIVFKKWAIQSVETKHDAPLDDDDDDDDDI
jgi:preprotein translocase subunit YajC